MAILSALSGEQQGLLDLLHEPRQTVYAGRLFWQGFLYGHPVVLALSKIGKVAAATTACVLIERFGVRQIVFTGVAGGLGAGVKVGDVVVASEFMQHDLDSSPLFPRYEVPLYGQCRFSADAALSALLLRSAQEALVSGLTEQLDQRGFPGACVHTGLIASGDRFVCGAGESAALLFTLAAAGHPVLAVEMECAAVAQVCHDYSVSFAAMRTISDRADDTAHVDFPEFMAKTARVYASAIMGRFVQLLSKT